jgi:hypothetical protein
MSKDAIIRQSGDLRENEETIPLVFAFLEEDKIRKG